MLPTKHEIEAEQLRRSFWLFVVSAWFLVESRPFVPGWHIKAICDHLQAVADGDIRRLLINVPPRHGKSTIVSVLFAAWLWTVRPEARMLFASYGLVLAERDSVRMRRVIESEWYQQRFGYVRLTGDQNSKTRFENTRNGSRIAVSVGGGATGEGGDIIVVDDPLKIEQARSDAARSEVNDWFDQTISTRLNDPAHSSIIVIAQRLHEDDLTGHLLRGGGWQLLCLAAEFDPQHPHLWPGDPRSEPNELLWEAQFGREEIEEQKMRLGSYGTAGLLQQLPAPARGGIVEAGWFRYYDPEDLPPLFDTALVAWDLSFTGNEGSDFVVGQLWGALESGLYLLRQVRRRMHFGESRTAVVEMCQWAHDQTYLRAAPAVVIEKAANAHAIYDDLRRHVRGLRLVPPRDSKRARLEAVAPLIEAGNVFLPRAEDWGQELVTEVVRFPNGAYDDQVDALTLALIELSKPGPRLRGLWAR